MRIIRSLPRHVFVGARNQAPLSEARVNSASATFVGLEPQVNAHYDPNLPTAFIVVTVEGAQVGEVRFGRDIYPGPNVADPNATLGLKGAVAHELAHYYRWHDMTQIDEPELKFIDEALTSLQAALRYHGQVLLTPHDVLELVHDAAHRLNLFVEQYRQQQQQAGNGQDQPPGAGGGGIGAPI